jgi:shikimate dehydrogenase
MSVLAGSPDTRLIGLIGSGIGHSLSPALHESEAREQGLRCLYRLIDLDDLGLTAADTPELLTAAHRLGFDGLNLTHPSKQVVLAHLDELSADAAALGAVNTVVFRDGRAVGHNTDWSGFARAFARGLPGARVERVALLGAGGAGAAVAHAALTFGAGRLTIVDLDDARAKTLAARLGEHFGADRVRTAHPDQLAEILATADGLIHATPTGMAGHPGIPLPAGYLHSGLWVADIVYRPLDTELLQAARAEGCRTLDGGEMAVFQAVEAFRLFTGRPADADRMLRHFHDLVKEPETVGEER